MDVTVVLAAVFAVLGVAVAFTIMSAKAAAEKRAGPRHLLPPPPFLKAPKPMDRVIDKDTARINKMMEKPFPEDVAERKAKAMLGRYALQKIVEADPKAAAQVVSRWNEQGKAQKP